MNRIVCLEYSLYSMFDDSESMKLLSYREPVSYVFSYLYRSVPAYIEHNGAVVGNAILLASTVLV